jgi:hypothetical protein
MRSAPIWDVERGPDGMPVRMYYVGHRVIPPTWREQARQVIAEVIATAPNHPDAKDLRDVIRSIDAAYPFGERDYWPYKVWLSERTAAIRRLRGEPPKKGRPASEQRDTRTLEMFA